MRPFLPQSLSALTATLLTTCLSAQQPHDSLRYVPADAHWVARMAAPADWGALVGKTRVAQLLASQGFADVWSEVRTQLEPTLELEPAMLAKIERLVAEVAKQRGEIVVAGGLDFGAMQSGGSLQVWHSLTWSGSDPAARDSLLQMVRELLPTDAAVERQIAGIAISFLTVPGGELALPFVQGDQVLCFHGTDLERQIERALANATPFVLAPEVAAGVCGGQIEVTPLLKGFHDVTADVDEPDMSMVKRSLTVFGASSVQRLAATMRADGPHLAQEYWIDFDGSPRGVFDALLPVRQVLPKLVQLVPTSAKNWSVKAVDVDALTRNLDTLFAEFAEDLPLSKEQLDETFTQFTKLRLREDVLAHFDGSYMRIESFHEMDDTDYDDVVLAKVDERWGDACFVFGLRNGDQFAKNMELAVRARGMHVGRRSEDYGEARIYSLAVLGMLQVEYVIAGDVLAISLGGEGTKKHLRGVLDAMAARAAGKPAEEPRPEIAALLQRLPPGYCELDVGSMVEVLDGMLAMFDAYGAELATEGLTLEDLGPTNLMAIAARRLLPEVRRVGADASIIATYSTRRRVIFRGLW